MEFADTIFALSSGKLPSGIAVIRLSGPHAGRALQEMTGEVPSARTARYVAFRDIDGSVLDRGIALYFPPPASFTGEACGELHVHGGRAVVAAMLARLGRLEGMRPAEAGEFTRRAFLNGKLDLSAAEALSDLIAAETEAQRRLAVEGAAGRQRELYLGWRNTLLGLRGEIEAHLDFSDQEDVPAELTAGAAERLAALRHQIDAHIALSHRSELIRDGFRVVILGAPNAGKSSLLNALARREVAIVTEEPGTTRDMIEVALDLAGNKVVLVDTAGLRKAQGRVEAIGIERAMAAAKDADLVMRVLDLSDPRPVETPFGAPVLRVGLKADLPACSPPADIDLVVSALTGAGLEELLDRLTELVRTTVSGGGDALPLRERHVAALRRAIMHLDRASAHIAELEICAEELRTASRELASIVGIINSEDLLGEIFSRFCIGK